VSIDSVDSDTTGYKQSFLYTKEERPIYVYLTKSNCSMTAVPKLFSAVHFFGLNIATVPCYEYYKR